ncbi:MAG: OB-fold nucleic acid binding domain-containing protein [Sulfolobales archaeon]|nr:OB-fold nucleic acid binding domain-containing protein [Sulfolobales archaeon]MDW8083128.1 OB-fold nucleic acid binding domain-containing protein [Sulfolobales archaeon]
MSEGKLKVAELKPGMERVSVFVRVIDPGETKKITTKAGERTIREATVGDESGRVKLVMWGKSIKSLKRGDVIEVSGAWTTVFKGKVQLNVGGSENVKVAEDLGKLPSADEVPEEEPKAEGAPPRRPRPRGFQQRRSRFGSRSRGEEFE